MIQNNSFWNSRFNAANIDLRPRLTESTSSIDSEYVTGFVSINGNAEWRVNDRPVETSEVRLRHSERILQAVADCLVESVLVEATGRGIQIKSALARVEAVCPPIVRPHVVKPLRSGPARMEIVLQIDANATNAEIGQLVVAARKNSPAFDMVANGVKIEFSRIDS